jgi:hypothetical protein
MGYDSSSEDRLLQSVSWEKNGYRLYKIATSYHNQEEGFFSKLNESNCVGLLRSQYQRLGGYDERFRSKGGGLVNLDFFNRALLDTAVEPVLLLGEATFHQVHGGVSTNVPWANHPWPEFCAEYEKITGTSYRTVARRPNYLGALPEECVLKLPRFRS